MSLPGYWQWRRRHVLQGWAWAILALLGLETGESRHADRSDEDNNKLGVGLGVWTS